MDVDKGLCLFPPMTCADFINLSDSFRAQVPPRIGAIGSGFGAT